MSKKHYKIVRNDLRHGEFQALSEFSSRTESERKKHRQKRRTKFIKKIKVVYINWCKSVGKNTDCVFCKVQLATFNIQSPQEIASNMSIVILCNEDEVVNFRRGDVVLVCKKCCKDQGLENVGHNEKRMKVLKALSENKTYVDRDDITKRFIRLRGSFEKKD